jgi:cytochrome c peroxidase
MTILRRAPALAVLACCLAVAACTDFDDAVQTDVSAPLMKRKDGGTPPPSGDIVALGSRLFADARLSVNGNQSCQSCHHPDEGFAAAKTGNTQGSVVEGSIPGQFGDRKPPSAAYATIAPLFAVSGNGAVGGNFWDGRATGALLGNPAADQAMGPFVNPKEQALPDIACVVYFVRQSAYLNEYRAVWTNSAILDISFPSTAFTTCTTPHAAGLALSSGDRMLAQGEFENVARSIAAFEASLNVYRSRFDAGSLTAQEQEGLKLFNSKGKCQQCHASKGAKAPFTDFAYHNLGVPKNPQHPVYAPGSAGFDPGLGGFTGNTTHLGRFRTPTLRNVAQGANRTYMHNGALLTLEQVVDFYSTRDVLRSCAPAENDAARWGTYADNAYGCWPAPEYPLNLDTKNMGKLGLTRVEVDAIVAFMRALTDS